jgi:hypothetical protein
MLTQVSIRGDIRREWARTRFLETLAEAGLAHVDSSGHKMELPVESFEENWTMSGVLCSVTLDRATGKRSLHIKPPETWV